MLIEFQASVFYLCSSVAKVQNFTKLFWTSRNGHW